MGLIVRSDDAPDFAAIDEVHLRAFADDAHSLHNEHVIVRALRDSGALTVSLVAEAGRAVVGHVAISPVRFAEGTPGWYGLGPVAVAPEHQRQGVGTRLVRDALRRLQELGGAGCVVVGDPGYYARFGFRPADGIALAGVPPEYVQVLHFAGPRPRGTVTYDRAFEAQA